MKKFRIYSWREVEAEDAFSAEYVRTIKETKDFLCADVSKVSGTFDYLHEAGVPEGGYDLEDIITMLSTLDLSDDELVLIASNLGQDLTVTAYIEDRSHCCCEP